MEIYNMTTTGVDAIASMPPIVLGILIFITIVAMIFLISKFFRYICYGAVVTTGLIIIYKISASISNEAAAGNSQPLKYFLAFVGFCGVSILIGYFVAKTEFVKKFEEKITKMDAEVLIEKD